MSWLKRAICCQQLSSVNSIGVEGHRGVTGSTAGKRVSDGLFGIWKKKPNTPLLSSLGYPAVDTVTIPNSLLQH